MRARTLVPTLALTLSLAGCAIPRWPVGGPITSPFGVRWRGLLPEIHRGVDIQVLTGTPVRAMAPGKVIFAGVMGGYGNVVWIDHGGDVLTAYPFWEDRPERRSDRSIRVRARGSLRPGAAPPRTDPPRSRSPRP